LEAETGKQAITGFSISEPQTLHRTPLAYLEVVMNAAFRRLVEDGGDVSVQTGVRAAEKLQSDLDKRHPGDEIADIRRQVNLILDAVKTVVPEEYWGQIVARLDQVKQHPEALYVEADSFDDTDDDGYDPTEFINEDTGFRGAHRPPGRWDRCRCGRDIRGRQVGRSPGSSGLTQFGWSGTNSRGPVSEGSSSCASTALPAQ